MLKIIYRSRTFYSSSIPIKQSVKRLISYNNFKYKDLRKIGYPETESRWIVNMRDAYFYFDDTKNLYFNLSYKAMYTGAIVNVIKKNNWKTWKNNFIHISFYDIFTQFYSKEISYIGNELISYNFHNNKFIRDEFMEHRKICLTNEDVNSAYSNLIKHYQNR